MFVTFGIDPKRVAERTRLSLELGRRPPWWRVFSRRAYDRKLAAVMAMDVSAFGSMMREMYPASMVADMAAHPLPNYARVVKAPKGPQ